MFDALKISPQAERDLGRIAAAIEKIAKCYAAECEAAGLIVRPDKPVKDPVEERDITYTDDDKEFLEKLKKDYGVLTEEERASLKASVDEETAKRLESE